MAANSPANRRTRQLALVAVCLLGLLVAAFAAPTISASGPGVAPPPGGGGGGSGSPGGGDGGGGAGIRDLVRWLLGASDEGDSTGDERDGDPPPLQRPGTRTPAEACSVRFVDDPLPGERATIAVTKGFDEIEGARVTLNGEFVGLTDSYGRVEVRVPYERRLVLDATLPSDVSCSRVARPNAVAPPDAAGLSAIQDARASAPVSRYRAVDLGRQVDGSRPGQQTDEGDDENVTNTYAIDASVNITIEGRPIPGEEVVVEATVGGVPMQRATVEVDGERVGRTDNDGEYDLTLPADGRDRITVRVSRGDFNGSTQVDLAGLSASLSPATVVAIPGGKTRLTATLGDEPVAGAVVSYDGRTLGKTNARGRTTFALPSDPTATITVAVAGQRVRKAVWPLYAGTAVFGALALGAVAIAVALLVYGVAWLVRFVRWLASAVLGLATRLEGAVVWCRARLGRLRRWLADLVATGRESVPSLLSRFVSWLLDLPGRVLAGCLALLGWVRVALVWLWHAPGRLWRWLWSWRGEDTDDEEAAAADETTGDVDDQGAATAPGPTALRERWRAFARWVSPRDWRRRTPGEVARDAVATGFPDEPVETLTSVFRDVEYGDAPLSEERRERAREAFEALSSYRQATGDRRRQPGSRDEADRTRSTDGGRRTNRASEPGRNSSRAIDEEVDES